MFSADFISGSLDFTDFYFLVKTLKFVASFKSCKSHRAENSTEVQTGFQDSLKKVCWIILL